MNQRHVDKEFRPVKTIGKNSGSTIQTVSVRVTGLQAALGRKQTFEYVLIVMVEIVVRVSTAKMTTNHNLPHHPRRLRIETLRVDGS